MPAKQRQWEEARLSDLQPDPGNVRLHDRRNLAAIKGSLRRFGQQRPIVVDADGVILAGHGMFAAATELGWEAVGVLRSQLTGQEAAAYSIADNRTGELSEWDYERLTAQLRELTVSDDDVALTEVDLSGFGWTARQIEELANWRPQHATGKDMEDYGLDPIRLTGAQLEAWEAAALAVREPDMTDAEVLGSLIRATE